MLLSAYLAALGAHGPDTVENIGISTKINTVKAH